MAEDKTISNTETDHGMDELIRIVHNHLNPVSPTVSSPTGSTRTYSPPLMGTSARAAKRRMDSDSTPVRIEGTDTYNQQLQHHYQNVRQILEDQEQPQISNVDTSPESRQSFSAKRDYFEQHFKTPQATYDSPPRQQQPTQKIITTITTTTATSPSIHDRTSSSSNESPSVDRVLEQAVELQKMSNNNTIKNMTQPPLIIERTEQYQVFLDSANHEIRRTPSISRTSIVPITKIGHATDLDQAQAQVEHFTDDHQAIQNLTRALQEHNITTINEYKRLPSQLTPTPPSSLPSGVLLNRTNLSITSDYSVIDALLINPLGTMDEKHNNLLNTRYNDIITNLHNSDYVNSLKQSQPSKSSKKKTKEKKSKDKPAKTTTNTVQHAITTPLVRTPEPQKSPPIQTREPLMTTISSEQTPLINPKEKKKQDKENKKQIKTKSKQKSKNDDYQVLDAILSSPVALRLPDSYLVKYNVTAPLTQTSPLPTTPPPIISNTAVTTTSKETTIPISEKDSAVSYLAKIISDLQFHHAAALVASVELTPSKIDTKTTTVSKEPVITSKQSLPVASELSRQRPLLEQQQQPIISSNQATTHRESEPPKPRICYRYLDEQGRVLIISPTPPSQLREQPPQQQYSYRSTEPPYFHGRHIVTDDERRHPLPQYEQRATWQGEPKLPTTVTREDLELRDKRIPQLSEQSVPTTRTIPVTVDHERLSGTPSQRTYHYPNQQNVKLAWLPLSYPPDQPYPPPGGAGYDTDSTLSERSTSYRPYDYGPIDSHYRYSHRPIYNDHYYNYSPGPSYYSPPPQIPYGGRGISPEYGNNGVSRNYIEVFRGGDFRETKPSEIYSLPLNEHIRTSPILPTNNRHSRYDQYQSERYGTITNRNTIPSSQQIYTSTLPNSRYQQSIPPPTVYYTQRTPYQHRTVQSSPNPDYKNYIRQSKSFDYRPLRTKLQREYKITPNLLVDEWDYPQITDPMKYSTTTTTTATNRSGVSSSDDVFINNQTNKA